MAPVLCAGVTVYKGIKTTGVRPGEWIVISGVGGLGHMAVQYAKAMGMYVAAVDIADDKLQLARQLGADLTVNAATEDPGAYIQREIGGAHGVLVTAVSRKAFEQSLNMVRRGGTSRLQWLCLRENFLSPSSMWCSGALAYAAPLSARAPICAKPSHLRAQEKCTPKLRVEPVEKINEVFEEMKAGKIEGRVVLKI
jgi:propanol-preferring alcohol dehydrogenase